MVYPQRPKCFVEGFFFFAVLMVKVTVRVKIFRHFLPNESHNGGGMIRTLLHQVTNHILFYFVVRVFCLFFGLVWFCFVLLLFFGG